MIALLGRALAFASYRLKRTADVIFAALRQDKTAIDFVDADSIDGDPALIEFFRGGQVVRGSTPPLLLCIQFTL